MKGWVKNFLSSLWSAARQANPMRWLRKARKANIPDELREICERYGEDVIGMVLASGHTPRAMDLQVIYHTDDTVESARVWLTQRSRSRLRRERFTLFLEIVVVALIGWEISLGYRQERLQSRNFKEQQQVLTNLENSSAATASTLGSLQNTTQIMNRHYKCNSTLRGSRRSRLVVALKLLNRVPLRLLRQCTPLNGPTFS